MPTIHIVKQGECLSLIARRYGFSDYKKVYEHPDNAALRKKRPDPDVLFPGDEVVIPELAGKAERLSTGRVSRFTAKRPKRYLRLVLEGEDGQPLGGKPFTLTVDGEVIEGTTDGEGAIDEQLPLQASHAELECEGLSWSLQLGHLNPLRDVPENDISGAEARLLNLGYAFEPTGRMSTPFRSALRAFQHQHGVEAHGNLDAATLDKLKERHGS
ncbi:MAG TPA: peptidoglycan-binding protein [Myxococcus sp.]|nr:peptidoglycan-binding protein [Myxococcus sp.]